MEQLSREELLAAQAQVIEEQLGRIEALTAQGAGLTRRLGQNSGSSSLPPSSDRFVKPKRDRGKPSARKPGKQPGSALEYVADPDEVIDHVPAACQGCGTGLDRAEAADP